MAHRKPIAQVTCESKLRYGTEAAARKALRHHIRVRDWNGKDRPVLDVYLCPVCAGWHAATVEVEKNRVRADRDARARGPRAKGRYTDPDAYSDEQ